MVELAEAFIRERLPEKDANLTLIDWIVDRIIVDRDIFKVEDIVSRFDLSKRTLQRIFSRWRISPAEYARHAGQTL